jgi:hypothetical protein
MRVPWTTCERSCERYVNNREVTVEDVVPQPEISADIGIREGIQFSLYLEYGDPSAFQVYSS